MKRLFLILAVVGTMVVLGSVEALSKTGVRFTLFHSSLSSYGEWVDCSYGNVWRPLNVQHGWRPYLYGRWIWTDYGWYWYSDEPFGWATFHYGRWQYDDYYGWIWIPDDVWGPAWVEWRYSNDYIGWAPLSPAAHFSFSIGISFSTGWNTPVHYWNFVPCRSFTSTRIVDYVQPVERTRRFFGSTRGVRAIEADGNRVVNRGIDVDFVEKRTRTRIERTDIVTRTEGNGDRITRTEGRQRLEAYRPHLEGSTRETGIEQRQGDRRENDTRGGVTGAERRTETLNRNENSGREAAPRRHYEVQRNTQLRREPFEQRKEHMRDNRQNDVNRSFQMRERKEVQRRDAQVERRTEQRTQERRVETGKRETQKREAPRVERAPRKQGEKPPAETQTRRRRQ